MSQPLPPLFLTTDDWFVPGHETSIIDWGYRKKGGQEIDLNKRKVLEREIGGKITWNMRIKSSSDQERLWKSGSQPSR